ncbi:MAG TPA: LpqB family beta-propeller domain-containing protein [Streptosporangiaceae bacterium]
MTERVRRGVLARWAVVGGVVLAASLVGGCATIPVSGPVVPTPIPAPPGGCATSCSGLIVQGPQANWSPVEVVSGFLQASASFAHNHAVARQYLTAGASKLWQPGAQVTILSQSPNVQRQSGQLPGQTSHANVVVSWQKIATLEGSGQYIPVRGGAAQQQVFGLESVGGQWRIATLPAVGGQRVSTELLLPSVLFHLVYAPRDLYFYGQPGQLLVPDPVFVPIESTDVVSYVLNGLKQDPNGWLQNAAVTAFPSDAQLRKVQVFSAPPGGKTAIVDIGLPPRTPRSTVQAMAAQIVWTLTSSPYSPALLQAVKLKVNGHAWAPGPGDTVLGLNDYGGYVPRGRKNPDLYYLSTAGAVRMFGRLAHSVPVPGEAGTGRIALTGIAVSPDGNYLAGVAGPASTVYTGDLAAAAKAHASTAAGNLHIRLAGTGFTGLSWDSSDNLWVAGKVHHSPGVWVVPPKGSPVRVNLPPGLGPVTGLKVAPDGVRIALIIGQGSAARVVLGAIARVGNTVFVPQVVPLAPGLSGPSALTWYDGDHLLAITQQGTASQLWEVPVNGDAPVIKSSLPGMVSITSAGAENPLYLGMSTDRLDNSVGLGEPWRDIAAGRDATYPG